MRKITKILVAATLAFAMTFGAGMVTQMKITGEADGNSADVITVVSPAQKSVVSADNEVIAEFFAKYKGNSVLLDKKCKYIWQNASLPDS